MKRKGKIQSITIGDRLVGEGCPCFIIAEIGTNHNSDLACARELVRVSSEAGVDAVKFQIYEADDIVNHRILTEEYGLQDLYVESTMHQVFDRYLRTPREWFPELSEYARELGVLPMATAHSGAGASFIAGQGMAAVKIASMDLNNLPVLRDIVERVKVPVIFSTGMSELPEIDETVRIFKKYGKPYAILHCVSNYPAEFAELQLQNIRVLREMYGVPVGFSDHTLTTISSVAAVFLGASIIEKHITLNQSDLGPDHPFALEPAELKKLVEDIRRVESAYAPEAGFVGPGERERAKRILYRRSLVARRDLEAGSVIREEDIKITRPGNGILPKDLGSVIGRITLKKIEAETPLQWEMIES